MAPGMARRERVYEAIAGAMWETPAIELGPAQVEEAYRITDLVLAALLVADNQTDDGAASARVPPSPAVSPTAPSSQIDDGAAAPPVAPTATPAPTGGGEQGVRAPAAAESATTTAAPSSPLPQTDDGAVTPGQVSGGSMPGSLPEASEVAAGTAPSSPFPRRFLLFRHADVSGVSGTGVVAEGAEWTDGAASLRWRGQFPSTVAWDDVELMLGAHGHQGATELRWIDPEPHVGYWPVEGDPE